MSPIAAAVLRSVVLPATLVGLALVFSGGRAESKRRQGVVVALGFALGAYLLLYHLGLPPADVNESFSFAALLLAGFTVWAPTATGPRYLARALVTLAALALVVYHIAPQLGGVTSLRNLAAFYFLSLGTWSITESSAARLHPPAVIVAGFITILALSAIAMISGSATLSQLAGTLAGLTGASLAVAVVMPRRLNVGAVTPFLSALPGLFAAAAHFYLDVNPWHLIACFWPFAVLTLIKHLPLPRRALVEAAVVATLAVIPLGFFLKHLVETAGPLY